MRTGTKSFLLALRYCDIWLLTAVFLGAFLRLIRLGDYDNSYYTATVASMLQNPHNFLFGSFDSVGLVMVDKPPVSFWMQAVSAAIFGLSSWSVTFPQAILGILAIVIIYYSIRPTFGRMAAISSAMVLAVIPASVVIDSRNEPDSLLSFILLLAAVSMIWAVRTGQRRWLVLFGILMGVGFNVKMLVAFVPLPAFLAYFILVSGLPLRELLRRNVMIIATLLVVSFLWILLVALTPAENRPYVGSTPDDSIWTLVLRYNGINRFTSFIGPRIQQAVPQGVNRQGVNQQGIFPGATSQRVPQNQSQPLPGQGPVQIPTMVSDVPTSGLLGLFSRPLASQLGWILPVGLVSLLLIVTRVLTEEVYNRPIKVLKILKTSPTSAHGLLWGGWLGMGLMVFGLASSTTTHPYYLVGIAVPLAGTIGIGASFMLDTFRRGIPLSWIVTVILTLFAGYQIYGAYTLIGDWLIAATILSVLFSVLIMAVALWQKLQTKPLAGSAFVFGAIALLLIPITLSINSGGRIVGANLGSNAPARASQMIPGGLPEARVLDFLNSVPAGQVITLATVNAREAAPFIIAGISTIAIGGFSGRDPVLTVDSFKALSADEGIKYFLMPPSQLMASRQGNLQQLILDYVRNNWKDLSRRLDLPAGSLYANSD